MFHIAHRRKSLTHDTNPWHHKPHVPQITSACRHSHNMVRSTEERFRRGAQGDLRLRRHESVRFVGVQCGKTLLVCHSCRTNISGPQNLKMGQKVPKNPNFEPSRPTIFSTTVPQMVENTMQNEGAQHVENICIFAMCTFPLVRGTVLKHDITKRHAFLVAG